MEAGTITLHNTKTGSDGEAHTGVKMSVVIPCFNHGKFLGEAVDSVLQSDFEDYEIIIVNDGSTDTLTLRVFEELQKRFSDRQKVTIISQENAGLPSARNAAIQRAVGEYILPLDADNRIRSTFLRKAAAILDTHREVGVVYAYANLFGDKKGIWTFPRFDPRKLLIENFVEACSVFRKKLWEECSGYDPAMVIGYEDWDFWISVMEKGWRFHLIEEVLFDYRVREDSLVSGCNIPENHREVIRYICTKHKDTFSENLSALISDIRERESFIQKVYEGNGWHLLMKYYRLRDRFLPEGTRRRKLFERVLHLK